MVQLKSLLLRIREKQAAVFLLALVLVSNSMPSASAVDEFTVHAGIGTNYSSNSYTLEVQDKLQREFSALYYEAPNRETQICSSIRDSWCDKNLKAETVLPPCLTSSQMNCVEEISLIRNEKSIKLEYIRSIATRFDYTYEPNSKVNLPVPGSISLWKVPQDLGGEKYSINATLLSSLDGYLGAEIFQPKSLSVSVDMYNERAQQGVFPLGPSCPTCQGWVPKAYGANYECAWQELNLCGVKQVHALDSQITVKLRVPKTLSGWAYGRMASQTVLIEDLQNGFNRISISALPVPVQGIVAEMDLTRDIEYINKWIKLEGITYINPIKPPLTYYPKATEVPSTTLLAVKDFLKDKAQYVSTRWSFYTKENGVLSNPTSFESEFRFCSNKSTGIVGMVTSNAPFYSSEPPTFDGLSLDYQVAGLHKNYDDSIFYGSYNLSINSDFARCIYKFTGAPITARISVIADEGVEKIATTTFNQSGDWIYFTANGFTFSSPTIRIALSQEKLTPTPLPTASKAPTSKKISIKCIKGKQQKLVTGLKPKCPTGYKQK